jgi:hypothetical protein
MNTSSNVQQHRLPPIRQRTTGPEPSVPSRRRSWSVPAKRECQRRDPGIFLRAVTLSDRVIGDTTSVLRVLRDAAATATAAGFAGRVTGIA